MKNFKFYLMHDGRKGVGKGIGCKETLIGVITKEAREAYPDPLTNVTISKRYYDVGLRKHVEFESATMKEVRYLPTGELSEVSYG
jgi:hypothetical protein